MLTHWPNVRTLHSCGGGRSLRRQAVLPAPPEVFLLLGELSYFIMTLRRRQSSFLPSAPG